MGRDEALTAICNKQIDLLTESLHSPVGSLFNLKGENPLPEEMQEALRDSLKETIAVYHMLAKNPLMIELANITILRMMTMIANVYYEEFFYKYGGHFLSAQATLQTYYQTREIEISIIQNIHKYPN